MIHDLLSGIYPSVDSLNKDIAVVDVLEDEGCLRLSNFSIDTRGDRGCGQTEHI